MGKREKEHRKKVAKRNQKIDQAQKIYKRMYNEMMTKEIERVRESQTGNTESNIIE